MNQTKSYNVVGVMSGTSLDGLDIVLTNFKLINKQWEYKIVSTKTAQYSDELKSALISGETLSGLELSILNNSFGEYIGTNINSFLRELDYKIDLIASHGHTIFHQVEKHLSLQIGNGASIAAKTNIPTVSDFRALDVALGGEGAPLVPNGEKELFPQYSIFLNLGGIANISIHKPDSLIGFDITAANMLLNYISKRYFNLEYDKNGRLASEGITINTILKELRKVAYFDENHPKSLGKEFVYEKLIPIIDKKDENPKNILRTCIAHIVEEIKSTLEKHHIKEKVFISGGGTLNSFLIEELKSEYANIEIPTKEIIEYKEALIFAFLGLKRYLGEVNCYKSITGAKKDSSSGSIFLA